MLADVRFGSNSAVSRFLRHGCFTPETGHWLARLARPKTFTAADMPPHWLWAAMVANCGRAVARRQAQGAAEPTR
jgi:hypothetical protein